MKNYWNHETLRAYSEIVNADYWIEYICEQEELPSAFDLEQQISQYCYDIVDMTIVVDGFAKSLVYEFLNNVDWGDIACHILDDASELLETIDEKVA